MALRRHIRTLQGQTAPPLAMQKVEGSNPFSRFAPNPDREPTDSPGAQSCSRMPASCSIPVNCSSSPPDIDACPEPRRSTGRTVRRSASSRAMASAAYRAAFQGMPRDVSSLEYEAYREMAERQMATILRDCLDSQGLAAAAAEHRIGSVPLGEPSVIVAASAAHRREAFAGAREAIDRIKAEAPIWKRA